MADDEEAIVIACKTISCFIIIYFQLTNEINSFIDKIYEDHNFIHITNKLKLRITPVALVETSLSRRAVSRLMYSMRDTARTTFSYTKMHWLDSVTQQVEFGL